MVEYMVDWWEKRCFLTPDHIAVVDGETGERLTYKELNIKVKRLAVRLQAQGIRRGDRLGCLLRITLRIWNGYLHAVCSDRCLFHLIGASPPLNLLVFWPTAHRK